MSEKLDESALRRPDFRGGSPVTMADGQEWFLPRPRILWQADDSEAGVSHAWDVSDYEDRLKAIDEAETGILRRGAEAKLFAMLLRLNYTLDTASLGRVLQFSLDPEQVRLRAVYDDLWAALGGEDVPKPTPDGSDSPGS